MSESSGGEFSTAHKRGVAVTLGILDEAICEMEQWATGRELHSALYVEHNDLNDQQCRDILTCVGEIRSMINEVKQTLGLEASIHTATGSIISQCSGIWEYLIELQSKHLRRYGEFPKETASYIDERSERLIKGVLDILDIANSRKPH
ncbi:MAG: hypothetical protein ACYC1M_00175 [Armatimonadota bacterium]